MKKVVKKRSKVCDNEQGSHMLVMSMRQQCKRLKANIFIILEPEMCSQCKQLDASFHQPMNNVCNLKYSKKKLGE